ncbi:MAG: decaprenyl-phosphate phosphoribosyltransferase [Armatimonadetes bacterium]|nr:decaprenyl-phosphate phosphoribosyltransferase [Armatimonadota bacterium]
MASTLSQTPPTEPPPPPGPRRGPLLALLVTMRPKQWIKNLLLFAGLLFTLDQGHSSSEFQRAALGFVLFCALSSVVYLVNDLADRESDRRHPKKRRRPIAAGELSPQAALVAAVALGVCGAIFSFLLSFRFGLVALTYLLLTFSYSFRLKHVVLVDVLALAAGFVLRAVAGAVVIGVSISVWLILCTLMLALFLGLSKRRAELVATRQAGTTGTRRILEDYSPEMLDQMIVIVTSSCLMSYALYAAASPAAGRHPYLMATIPFVVYGIFRYLYLMHRHSLGESPDAVLLEDRPMLVNVLLWGLTTALIVTHVFQRLLHLLPR